MGQYWIPVNLDKKEWIDPHKLGCGLKLWEQLANHPGVGSALTVLCAAMPEPRGGGDFDIDENFHGPGGATLAQKAYAAIAKRTIGRWAGNRIALIGDYAVDGDCGIENASKIYSACVRHADLGSEEQKTTDPASLWTEVTDDVVAVIEHELRGKYEGTGWRNWKGEA